jgi:hypothetical protein
MSRDVPKSDSIALGLDKWNEDHLAQFERVHTLFGHRPTLEERSLASSRDEEWTCCADWPLSAGDTPC